jgi:LmeA-like phospholipid-binding
VTYNPYGSGGGPPRRRRRGGCLLVGVVVVVVLLVVADFVARAIAQNVAASQIQKQGFPKKPSVTIEGFPFLTQVISRDLHQIRLSSSDVPAGPVDITSLHAVADGIHLNSGYSSGTVDQVSGTVLISFGSLASALTKELGPAGSLVGSADLHLSDAGHNEIKASLDLVVASGSATWRVTRPSGQELNIHLVASSGVPSALLGPVSDFSFRIPKLPFGVTIQNVSVTASGIVGQISATHVAFSQ